MFLSGTSVIVIQRVGRWSSEAFLEYIREQVESFTVDVSKNMLRVERFTNLNEETAPTSNVTETDCNGNDNENGPAESVPFTVNFSKLALSNENDS